MKRMVLLSALLLLATGARGQWVQTNGPYGGEVSCFIAMGTNLFVGTYDGGVFRSIDSGLSWKSASSGFSDVTALGVIGSTLLAGSNDGVFYSTDSGKSWRPSINTPMPGGFGSITGIVTIGRTIFTAITWENSQSATYLSIDSGKILSNIGTPPGVIETVTQNGGKIFTGTDNGIFRSDDTGLTWTSEDSGLTKTYISSLIVNANVFGNENLLATAENSSFTISILFLSTNNGSSWTPIDSGLPSLQMQALEMIDSNIYVGTDSGLYLSTNTGTSWTYLGLSGINIETVSIIGTHLLAGTQAGVYLSTGDTTYIVTGLPSTNIYSMATQGSNLIAGTSFGDPSANVFFSSDNGTTWTITSYAAQSIGNPVWAIAADGEVIYAASDDYGVLVSDDSGQTWVSFGEGRANGMNGNSVYALAIAGSNIIAGSEEDQVFLSTNHSKTWNLLDGGLTNSDDNAEINALALVGTNVIAGSSSTGIFLSTDNGSAWATSDNGLTDTVVLALTVCGTTVFAGTYPDGVFVSSDGGENWTSANTGLEKKYVYSFAVSGAKIFAGTDSGVFLSTNNGAVWQSVSSSLPANFIHDIAVNDSFLFAGTDSAGVWRRPLSDFGISSVASQPLQNNSLTAYPNPFAHTTTLAFTSTQSGYATVTLINPLGKVVARVFAGELSGDNHSMPLTVPAALPAGMYECVVRMNGQTEEMGIVLQP